MDSRVPDKPAFVRDERAIAAAISGFRGGTPNYLTPSPLSGNANVNSTFFFGTGSENAITALNNAPSVAASRMGGALSYGRRTSDIIALNLAGKGGLPLALGRSSVGVKAVVGRIGSAFSLGLSFAERMGLDVAFTGAEAIDCSMTF